jgi:hypothetical protein
MEMQTLLHILLKRKNFLNHIIRIAKVLMIKTHLLVMEVTINNNNENILIYIEEKLYIFHQITISKFIC